jgi:hypothetical protein
LKFENEAKLRVRAKKYDAKKWREASLRYFHIGNLFSDLQDSIGEIDNMLNPAQKMEVYLFFLFILIFSKRSDLRICWKTSIRERRRARRSIPTSSKVSRRTISTMFRLFTLTRNKLEAAWLHFVLAATNGPIATKLHSFWPSPNDPLDLVAYVNY